MAPYVLDARRCISYLTIEHRGEIEAELGSRMGEWQFGCDLCQTACPWNRKAPVTGEAAFAPPAHYPGAGAVLEMGTQVRILELADLLRGRARDPSLFCLTGFVQAARELRFGFHQHGMQGIGFLR